MVSRILVPTDFSAPSDAALMYARLFGNAFDASLHLLHVTATHSPPPHAAIGSRDRDPAVLRELRDRLSADDRRRHNVVRLVEGSDPAGHIAHYARTANIGLIVMGTHGRSGVSRLLMGSVAEKVVRTAPCPVLTVHTAPRPSVAGFRRILVPTDFSASSDAALGCARLLAGRFGASVHLLHVLEEIGVDGGMGSEVFVTESPEARSMRLMDARDRLKHQISTADRIELHATTEVIFGPPAQTIVDYAADNAFDVIVMGTHGRTGMSHLMVGSVAERVVRAAARPVMTTREVWRQAESTVPVADLVRTPA